MAEFNVRKPVTPKTVKVIRAWDDCTITSWWDELPTPIPNEIEKWFVIKYVRVRDDGASPLVKIIRLAEDEVEKLIEVIKHG